MISTHIEVLAFKKELPVMTSTNTVFHMLVTSIEIIDDIYNDLISDVIHRDKLSENDIDPNICKSREPFAYSFPRLIIFHEGHAL